jgi:hypothetical protein
MARNTLSRSLHDLGLAAWFGGTLANAVALNPASGEAGGGSTGAVANAGWNRWTPVNTVSRALHDLGLSAWFGGTLANAVALNAAAGEAGKDTGKVANAGWNRWTPVNAVAIGAHLVGSVGQLAGNSGRVAQQKGVAGMSVLKTTLTVAALGVTAYSRGLGQIVNSGGATPAKSGTKPSKRTRKDVAVAQEQLDRLQWVIPALTGALVAISSYAGEQQRPGEVARGISAR